MVRKVHSFTEPKEPLPHEVALEAELFADDASDALGEAVEHTVSDTVDRSAKLAARKEKAKPVKPEADPKRAAYVARRRAEKKAGTDERIAQIVRLVSDPEYRKDEREPLKAEAREVQGLAVTLKRRKIDQRVRSRIQEAAQKRAENWAEAVESGGANENHGEEAAPERTSSRGR